MGINDDSGESSETDVLLKSPLEGSQTFVDPTQQRKRIRRAHRLMMLLSFVLNMEYSIILPTLFFYVERLHGNTVFYGWIGSSFSIAAFLTTFLYGMWVDRRPSREPLICGMILLSVGTAMYGLGFNSVWVVLAGRTLAGGGAGVRVVCLNYLVKTTTVEERTQAIANFYAVGMVGMIIAPGISLFMHLFDFEILGFTFDSVTLPGYFMSIVGAVMFVLVIIFVKDPQTMKDERGPPPLKYKELPLGLIPILLNQFVFVTCITCFELLIVPLLSQRYHWKSIISGVVFLSVGVLVLFTAFLSGFLSKRIEERKLILFGLTFFIIGCACDFDLSGMDLPASASTTLFCFSVLFVSVGFTMSFSAQPGLYSKLIWTIPNKGALMSWLSSTAAIAKVTGPLVVAYTLQIDENVLLGGMIASLGVALIVTSAFYKVLLPFRNKPKAQAPV